MPWSEGSGPTPDRSEQELLALVRAHAGRLRRRRLAATSMGALVFVLVVAVGAVAMTRGGDSGTSALHVTGPGPSSSLPETSLPTSTTAVATSTTVAPSPTSTVRPLVIPTTASPATATTRPMPTTTASTPTTSTSTTLAPVAQCTTSEVLVTATPNKASYARGEVVKITAAAENRSGHSCAPADPSLEVRDSTGAPVFNVSVIDMFTFGVEGQPMPTWDPGKALSTTFDWADTCPPAYAVGSCPAGTYTVVVRFGPYVSAPSPITLT